MWRVLTFSEKGSQYQLGNERFQNNILWKLCVAPISSTITRQCVQMWMLLQTWWRVILQGAFLLVPTIYVRRVNLVRYCEVLIRDVRPAPPRKIDKSRGAQRGKTDCRFHWWPLFITPTNYALEEEREGKYFHLTLCTDCDYLVHKNTFFKVREYNVFLYQNIIMHYKYLNNNN